MYDEHAIAGFGGEQDAVAFSNAAGVAESGGNADVAVGGQAKRAVGGNNDDDQTGSPGRPDWRLRSSQAR
jgi:hypothetical protein